VVRNHANVRRNVGHPTTSYRVAELLRFKSESPAGVTSSEPGL
jgi:hypothetical protein